VSNLALAVLIIGIVALTVYLLVKENWPK